MTYPQPIPPRKPKKPGIQTIVPSANDLAKLLAGAR